MKVLLIILAGIHFGTMAYAQSPFNGTFCGQGEVVIQGKMQLGTKTIEAVLTDTEFHLKRDHTDFGDGYMDGRPEDAVISSGNIISNGAVVGTISNSTLQTETVILGYDIKYTINSSPSGALSYSRNSVNGAWKMSENFPDLKPCP